MACKLQKMTDFLPTLLRLAHYLLTTLTLIAILYHLVLLSVLLVTKASIHDSMRWLQSNGKVSLMSSNSKVVEKLLDLNLTMLLCLKKMTWLLFLKKMQIMYGCLGSLILGNVVYNLHGSVGNSMVLSLHMKLSLIATTLL